MSAMTWVLILTGVALNAVAQLLLKIAARPLAGFSSFGFDTVWNAALLMLRSMPFWAGMICYGVSVCVWLAALSKAPVSTAYPMLSLGYVVVAVISVIWLGETLPLSKIAGIALICAGVVVVSRSSV